MKTTLTVIIIWIVSTAAFAQESNGSNQSTSLCGGRWEIFMSEIAVSVSLKVDKFTGEVFQLVLQKDKTPTWQVIRKEGNIKDSQKEGLINYQLFSSGMSMRYTYLLNTNTGLTWQLSADQNGVWYFQTIE